MSKKNQELVSCTLYDNYNCDVDDYREDYILSHDMEDDADVDENELYNWMYKCLRWDWEDLETNLKYSKYDDCKCVISGSVGTWRGRFDVEYVVCDSLWEAICKCAGSCDYVIVKLEDGEIHVTAIHHDGTNHFTINVLNNRVRGENSDLTDSHFHKKIYGWLF